MMSVINEIEGISRVTPLGLRFWDTLSCNPIGEGLTVTAYPVSDPSRRTKATSNRSGVYLLHNLPGLQESEYGRDDHVIWSKVTKKPFVVEVIDNQRRFQAFTIQVELPHQGVFTDFCTPGSPLESPNHLGIPLYSAMTRNIPSGIAVIYTHLWNVSSNEPASWAMMEACLDGQLLARSFADRYGRLALLFPYPEPLHSISSPPDSPPVGERLALVDQAWPIQLQAFYTPQHPSPAIPDLCQIVNQAPATMLHTSSPASPLTEVTLHYGKELVVRSQAQSIVWIVQQPS